MQLKKILRSWRWGYLPPVEKVSHKEYLKTLERTLAPIQFKVT